MRRIILALLLVFPLSGYGQTAKYILDGNDDVKIEFFNSTNVLVISNAILTNSSNFRNALGLGTTDTVSFGRVVSSGPVTFGSDVATAANGSIRTAVTNAQEIEFSTTGSLRATLGPTNFTLTQSGGALAFGTGNTTGAALTRSNLGLGSAATNPATAFQPSSANLTNLANNNASALTNFPTLNQNTTGTASNVTGVVALANGGTGATNQENARTALGLGTAATSAATAFQPSSANLTNLANNNASALTNFPTLNQNTTGTASNVTGVVALVNGGTGGTNTAQFQTALFNSSSLNAQSQRITNLATPVDDNDAATKAYVFNLFNRVAPTVTFTNSVNTIQIGSTITNVNLGWSISPTNTPVASQSITPVIGSMNTSLRATNATGSFTTDTTWTLIVNDGTGLPGGIRTNTTSISFRHYMSWGIASTTSLDNSQIQNLHTNTAAGAGREFRTGKGKSVSISGNGQYIYFAYPASFGAASFIVNNAPNTAWISNTVTYTNSSGNSSQFLIYRSTDVQFGTSIPITIN